MDSTSKGKSNNVAQGQIDGVIVETILPQAYSVIDQLLTAKGSPSKELVTSARRLLPTQYVNSFTKTKGKS